MSRSTACCAISRSALPAPDRAIRVNTLVSGNPAPIPGLPPDTERVFRVFATVPELSGFVLVGGTAMALQWRHRLSEDLDFWLDKGTLRDSMIRPALEAARQAGLDVSFTGPTSAQSSAFRINQGVAEGLHLDDLIRDYAVGGVKVQFFVASEAERAVFAPFASDSQPRVSSEHVQTAFRIMPLDGLFAMKAHVIQRRHRSRDVLDLWHFVRAGRTISEIVQAAQRVSTTATAERAVAVLRGDWPVDAQDEGFHSLSPDTTLDQIRKDFCAWTDTYEQERAHASALLRR